MSAIAGAVQPPSNARTGHGNAGCSICAPTAAVFIVTQTTSKGELL